MCWEPPIVDSGYSSIDVSEIRKYAGHNGISIGTLMAYAATHEIEHLLLGEKHASSGIMRAVWGKPEPRHEPALARLQRR
ncbi:MAG: hypothetical protein ABSF12_03875 [Bryobacteraceae bacterium]|jgi:hypothetical protein